MQIPRDVPGTTSEVTNISSSPGSFGKTVQSLAVERFVTEFIEQVIRILFRQPIIVFADRFFCSQLCDSFVRKRFDRDWPALFVRTNSREEGSPLSKKRLPTVPNGSLQLPLADLINSDIKPKRLNNATTPELLDVRLFPGESSALKGSSATRRTVPGWRFRAADRASR